MAEFIKGIALCEGFFNDAVKPVINEVYPSLKYSAGLLGYGSDVLGYDDAVSTDHMWGPRLHLFLSEKDMGLKDEMLELLAQRLPYTYKSYSVNFSVPNPNDNGVRHAEFITEGPVSPLLWINTVEGFVKNYLGLRPKTEAEWLSVSEHRLLGLTAGKIFEDMFDLEAVRKELSFYPEAVKLYLIASQWSLIAEEQAFAKRTADCGDDLGSRLVCARLIERLMRLCFLYQNKYAPYSKWFGTAFDRLDSCVEIKEAFKLTVAAENIADREREMVRAQLLVVELHNSLMPDDRISAEIQHYYGRDIKVLFVDRIVDKLRKKLPESLSDAPLIGTMSQAANFTALSDNKKYIERIRNLY